MPAPLWLGSRLIGEGLSALKGVGRSVGVGARRSRRGPPSYTLKHIPDKESFWTARTAGEVAGKARAKVEEYGAKAEIWARTKGKIRTSQAGKFVKRHPQGVGMAAGAGFGYATSDDDASTGQRLGRALGFGIVGGYGTRVGVTRHMSFRGAARSALEGEWKSAGRALGSALEMPAQWGAKHSIGAGALYGLVSDDATMMEGALFGGAAHLGVRSLRNAWGGAGEGWNLRHQKGLRAAINKMPLVRGGAATGMMVGAYTQLGEGDATGLNVLGGGILGGALGAGGAGAARFAINHPWITLGTVGPTLTFAGSAAEAAGTAMEAGIPGYDSLNADGDLALALHRLRRRS